MFCVYFFLWVLFLNLFRVRRKPIGICRNRFSLVSLVLTCSHPVLTCPHSPSSHLPTTFCLSFQETRILSEDNPSVPELHAVWENDTLNFRRQMVSSFSVTVQYQDLVLLELQVSVLRPVATRHPEFIHVFDLRRKRTGHEPLAASTPKSQSWGVGVALVSAYLTLDLFSQICRQYSFAQIPNHIFT